MAPPPRLPAPPRLRVALTGGIASGKTTVARLFAVLGVPVIDMDQVAREVVEPGTPGLAGLVERFGPSILAPDGRLDRPALRHLIFANAEHRLAVDALLHPLIRARTADLSRAAGGAYQLIVIPLLAESGRSRDYDRVLVVDCAPELQLRRLMVRDGGTESEARAILAAQASRDERLAIADDVIANETDLPALARIVEALHLRYRELAAVAG